MASSKPIPTMTSSAKNPNPTIQNNIFILNYKTLQVFRWFEQLSSSICCWIWLAKVSLRGHIIPFV